MPDHPAPSETEPFGSFRELARARLSAAEAGEAERFLEAFHAHAPPRDLLAEDPAALFDAALAIRAFGQVRAPGGPKIRVRNPDNGAAGGAEVEIVNDDMPFLYDSVTAALVRRGLGASLALHPILRVARGPDGAAARLPAGDGDGSAESWMRLRLPRRLSDDERSGIEAELGDILGEVRAAVEDWRPMRARAMEAAATIGASSHEDAEEARAFLLWMEDGHFTFLGYREYDYDDDDAGGAGRGLGLLRDPAARAFSDAAGPGPVAAAAGDSADCARPLLITKADLVSRVHRPVALDAAIARKFDDNGRATGERHFVGLFTSVAYNRSPREIPLLRRKVDNVTRRAGFRPASHDGKALAHIVETWPRDELLQAAEDELLETAVGVMHVHERQEPAAFHRLDPFERFASCFVFVPRDRYDSALRSRIAALLGRTFDGKVSAFYVQMSESPLVRLQVTVETARGRVPKADRDALERELVELCRSWTERLREAARDALGEEAGERSFRRYGDGFPLAYREAHDARAALGDLGAVEEADGSGGPATRLSRPSGAEGGALRLKFFRPGAPAPLSDIMPMLENMGARVLTETPHEVSNRESAGSIWLHDFRIEPRDVDGASLDLDRIDRPFRETLAAVWDGRMENDGFNRLVLAAGLDWREVSVVRAYARFLRQAGFTFSQSYMEETLAGNPGLARLLADLFLRRFDPDLDAGREADCAALAARIEEGLDEVANLDEDRILRRFLNLVQSTLRTNFFQRAADGGPKPSISFKLDSQAVEDLPAPRPLVEVWVCSPRVEAVHLRGGRVARGGIRWSDRREDFRTEILGLMKAQMTKNSVIVPVGSKGGFVAKRPPAEGGREAFQAEGVECYMAMMRGLLDITDNIVGDGTVPPERVVRHDADDPYLVVAADKGTATFSDIANGVARDYGFWLDDAFASGGSAGYDHKKMGITARGAWESVKRHFREIGKDIQNEDFTVVGCGDMSGDVFGNGMLLSRHIRLRGAFNHLHVFVDPDPDPTAGWAERKRLFELPRSSWADYDPGLISKGGGVFERSAKSIALTPEIRAAFAIEAETATPTELIRAMLLAETDLLWFGGIGAYVKSSTESHADVGDRATDALRVDGRDLRARVIGEGANLGVTQRGRIEYARAGGRINTDAIDNSAGVASSDREVNIKILLGDAVAGGDLPASERDGLLAEMTDAVAELVLKDNYDQSQALTMAQARGAGVLDAQGRLMRQLERGHLALDRAIEFLPDDEEIEARREAGGALTRPEIAVLLSYAKMELYDELLASDLPDDPAMTDDLERYFPAVLGERFAGRVAGHRLRREIVATYIANSMINRVGAVFVNAVKEQTGDSAPDIARAYIAARDVFGIRALWGRVEALDNAVPARAQTAMLHELRRLAERGAVWMLRHERRPLDLARVGDAYAGGIAALRDCLDETMSAFERRKVDREAARHVADGVPEDLARAVAGAALLAPGCEVARLSTRTGEPARRVAETWFAAGSRFALDWLRERAAALPAETHWRKMAVSAVIEDLYTHQTTLARNVLETAGGCASDPEVSIAAWLDGRGDEAGRADRLVEDLRAADGIDLAMLAVANGRFRALLGEGAA